MILPAVILPVVLMLLDPKDDSKDVTLTLLYDVTMPVSCDPLPIKKLPLPEVILPEALIKPLFVTTLPDVLIPPCKASKL